MTSALVLLSAIVGSTIATDRQLAAEDRNKIPAASHWQFYYVTTACCPEGVDRDNLTMAFKYMLPHVSGPQCKVIRNTMPWQVSDTLYRIDIAALGWTKEAWQQVIARDSYNTHPNALTHRADWFVKEAADCKESDAYYLLAYGFVPKVREDILKLYHVDFDPALRYGMIEGRSGVSQSGTRRIENWPISRGQAWRTRDSKKLTLETDPLEQPEGDFKHDGEEIILGIEMHDPVTRARGLWPRYFLCDGNGAIVDEAPVDLVEDHTRFRGTPIIRNAGGCIQCHGSGLNYPTHDALAELIDEGVTASVEKYQDMQALQAFYFGQLDTDIKRYNEDFAAMSQVVVGVEPSVATLAFKKAINRYDADLSVEDAAWEVGTDSITLMHALGWAKSIGAHLPARVSGLTEGLSIPRDAWEDGGCVAVQNIIDNFNRR